MVGKLEKKLSNKQLMAWPKPPPDAKNKEAKICRLYQNPFWQLNRHSKNSPVHPDLNEAVLDLISKDAKEVKERLMLINKKWFPSRYFFKNCQ